jgi:RND family efflux transporter MFP subunit
VSLALLLACVSAGCQRAAPEEEKTPPAPVQATAPRSLFLGGWTPLNGTAQPLPQHAARISAAVEGRVASVLVGADGKPVHEGQLVRAGDVVARLDDRVARANRDRAAAAAKELEEQKKQAGYTVRRAELEIQRLEDLRRRSTTTAAEGGIPLVAPVDQERAQITLQEAEAGLRAMAAKQETAARELQALDEQIGLYTLRAPIAGHLGMMQAMPGQTLSIGATVADVTDLDQIDILCFAPPDVAARLATGQTAQLLQETDKGEEAVSGPAGKVVFLAVQGQAETGNFAVKLRFPNPNLRLRANTVARAQVMTQPEKERLTIPDTALMEDTSPPTVVVVDQVETTKKEGKDEKVGKARVLQATVGVRNRQWHVVEILGLEDPEKKEGISLEDVLVVTKGAHGLRAADPVRLEEGDEDDEK